MIKLIELITLYGLQPMPCYRMIQLTEPITLDGLHSLLHYRMIKLMEPDYTSWIAIIALLQDD